MAKKNAPKACLEFGREVTRLDCGVAYALRALTKAAPDAEEVRTGLDTVRKYAKEAAKHSGAAKKVATKIEKEASKLEGQIKGQAIVPQGKIREFRIAVRELHTRAEELYRQGEDVCRG